MQGSAGKGDSKRTIENIIGDSCRLFELAWHKNPGARIEDVLAIVTERVREIGEPKLRKTVMRDVLEEMIHVEMEMRAGVGQHFSKLDYLRRFPDFDGIIESAWARLRKLFPGSDLFETQVMQTRIHDSESDQFHIGVLGSSENVVRKDFGPYSRMELIGEGGFGVVCKAFDQQNSRWVALKFPHRKFLKNEVLNRLFRKEAHRLIGLKHEGIVTTYALEEHEGSVAIAQQLIVGSDLKKSMNSERSLEQIAIMVAKIADALAYANRKGVIHRDLKPSNVLVDENDNPFITDFGLSLSEDDLSFHPNELCGTPPYMSPQQVAGLTRNLDGRTDIWSLGVILYELLAGKRPFRGFSRKEIFQQIETRDPKPIRESNSNVDRELQRICLKCLARSARERYLTADELADDLRHWLDTGGQNFGGNAEFLPKGIRSYGVEDAGFFLQLLPGARDRNNVPASVRFWTNVICNDELDESIPFGVVYGPSGSGKSSFIKAGVIPRVVDDVVLIYVECTQSDTEVRLIKALRKQFDGIPQDIILPDLFRGLVRRKWQKDNRKVLVVLDQFEQRLSVNDNYDQSQIAKAIRHCSGEELQCIAIVRDGFWLSLTRFVDALETDLLEGRNCHALDLFDKRHAREVLIKLGRAYKCLPPESEGLSELQKRFLMMTVNQLAKDNYVVCVQLAIFAEMFKSREWLPSELNAIGGVRGVGEMFLHQTFDEGSQNTKYQKQKHPARKILETLLPETLTEIRGQYQSRDQLANASGLKPGSKEFKELIAVLESDLKLISRTSRDTGTFDSDLPGDDGQPVYYQLTHDYLVPSTRSWLAQVDNETPKGRTKARLSSLAKSWAVEQDDRFLPSPVEYLASLRFLRKQDLTQNEKSLLGRSNRFYSFRLGVVFAVGVALTLASWSISNVKRKFELATSYVDSFLADQPDAVPANLGLMKQHTSYCMELLREKRAELSPSELDKRLRINLGLAMLGDEDSEVLKQLVDDISIPNDSEGPNIVTALRQHRELVVPVLTKTFLRIESDFKLGRNAIEENHVQLAAIRSQWVRLAAVLVNLGEIASVEQLLTEKGRNASRLEFVDAFSTWADNDSFSCKMIDKSKTSLMKGVLVLCLGKLAGDGRVQIPVEEWNEMCDPTRYSEAKNSFHRAAIEWTFTKLNATELPDIPRSNFVVLKSSSPSIEMMDREVRMGEFLEYVSFLDRVSETRWLDWFGIEWQKRRFDFDRIEDLDLPVRMISLIDAIMYCNWLSAREGLVPCYVKEEFILLPLPKDVRNGSKAGMAGYEKSMVANKRSVWRVLPKADGYRLPTQTEWQLALRNLGDPHVIGLRKGLLEQYGRLNSPACVVGKQFMPNENGIFDLFGNVDECCWNDRIVHWGVFAFNTRMVQLINRSRGGSFESTVESLRHDTNRDRYAYIRVGTAGFRLVRRARTRNEPSEMKSKSR